RHGNGLERTEDLGGRLWLRSTADGYNFRDGYDWSWARRFADWRPRRRAAGRDLGRPLPAVRLRPVAQPDNTLPGPVHGGVPPGLAALRPCQRVEWQAAISPCPPPDCAAGRG